MNFAKEKTHPKEIEANRFAVELLMPNHLFKDAVRVYKKKYALGTSKDGLVSHLAEVFNVEEHVVVARFQLSDEKFLNI